MGGYMTIKIENKIYYTVKDLVKNLGLSDVTVRNYLRDGKLKGYKPAKFWYVSEENLKLFLGNKK
jgi:predicted site-specific integrase-resolvase